LKGGFSAALLKSFDGFCNAVCDGGTGLVMVILFLS
jgi:hypothetical protein